MLFVPALKLKAAGLLVICLLPLLIGAKVKNPGVNASNLFPLQTGNCWEFDGRVVADGGRFVTRICVEPQEYFCGVKVTPLLFLKDKAIGYWGPGSEFNLRWFIADFENKNFWPHRFLRAVGDKRYRRDSGDWQTRGEFDSTVVYISKNLTVPAYVIFPERIFPPTSLFVSRQDYFTTKKEDMADCGVADLQPIESASWRVTYGETLVSTPAYKGMAIEVYFEEDFDGRGWVEKWYFAKDIGPVKIETFSQGHKLVADMPVMHQLELASYSVKIRDGKIKKRR